MTNLSTQELKQYKTVLQDLRMRLTEGLDNLKGSALKVSNRDSSGDLSGYSLHMADQASDNYDRDFLIHLASNEQESLYKIDEALKRIEDKVFGVCSLCDKRIPKVRLKAVPFAEYCVPCQQGHEKDKGKPFTGA